MGADDVVRSEAMATDQASAAATLLRLERFARLMDAALRIPGTNRRIGLDGLFGFIPGLGDGFTAILALYPILEAARLGAPTSLLLRMVGNVGVDALVGAVPLAGDVFDVLFKANLRNVELLRQHLARR